MAGLAGLLKRDLADDRAARMMGLRVTAGYGDLARAEELAFAGYSDHSTANSSDKNGGRGGTRGATGARASDGVSVRPGAVGGDVVSNVNRYIRNTEDNAGSSRNYTSSKSSCANNNAERTGSFASASPHHERRRRSNSSSRSSPGSHHNYGDDTQRPSPSSSHIYGGSVGATAAPSHAGVLDLTQYQFNINNNNAINRVPATAPQSSTASVNNYSGNNNNSGNNAHVAGDMSTPLRANAAERGSLRRPSLNTGLSGGSVSTPLAGGGLSAQQLAMLPGPTEGKTGAPSASGSVYNTNFNSNSYNNGTTRHTNGSIIAPPSMMSSPASLSGRNNHNGAQTQNQGQDQSPSRSRAFSPSVRGSRHGAALAALSERNSAASSFASRASVDPATGRLGLTPFKARMRARLQRQQQLPQFSGGGSGGRQRAALEALDAEAAALERINRDRERASAGGRPQVGIMNTVFVRN